MIAKKHLKTNFLGLLLVNNFSEITTFVLTKDRKSSIIVLGILIITDNRIIVNIYFGFS